MLCFRRAGIVALIALFAPGLATAADDPLVKKRKAEIAAECSGTGKFGARFESKLDLNGDGVEDYVFDLGDSPCAMLYCGSAGCTQEFWLSAKGGFKEAYSDNLRAWTIVETGGKRIFVAGMHGSVCGLSGAAPCNMQFTFKGTKLKTSRFKGEIDWASVLGN